MAVFEKSLGCGHCHLHNSCPIADADVSDPCDANPDGQGLGLLISASAVFLLPLATGIGGAFVAGEWLAGPSVGSLGRWQAGGLVGGLVLGMILAKLLLALRRRGQGISREQVRSVLTNNPRTSSFGPDG